MSDLPGVLVTGASGRMGQMLIREVVASEQAKLVGAVDRSGHDWVGQDIGIAMGGSSLGVVVNDNAAEAISQADIVIDFTTPEATLVHASLAAEAQKVH
ncbi:MAG: 4-hydroxy-tetrahydrodipicolinate reductase, partial [Pseudomonadota bacterium]